MRKLTTYINITGIDIVRVQTAFCYVQNDSGVIICSHYMQQHIYI